MGKQQLGADQQILSEQPEQSIEQGKDKGLGKMHGDAMSKPETLHERQATDIEQGESMVMPQDKGEASKKSRPKKQGKVLRDKRLEMQQRQQQQDESTEQRDDSKEKQKLESHHKFLGKQSGDTLLGKLHKQVGDFKTGLQ